jgi:type II secretion system protein H
VGRLTPRGAGDRFPSAAGFTLVEILVALAIVAIASSAAWLAWRAGGDASLRREADRFAGAIDYAAQRAQWRHEELGVSTAPQGWRFWRRDADRRGWVPVADDDVLASHALPEGIAIESASIAGRPVTPGAPVPIRASGRNDPSSYVLAAGEARVRVDADPINRVAVTAVP